MRRVTRALDLRPRLLRAAGASLLWSLALFRGEFGNLFRFCADYCLAGASRAHAHDRSRLPTATLLFPSV